LYKQHLSNKDFHTNKVTCIPGHRLGFWCISMTWIYTKSNFPL